MKRCVIVASGPSARGFVPPDDLTVIAVNGAIKWLSRADWFFTLDLSPDNLARLKERRPGCLYSVASEIPSGIKVDRSFKRIAGRGKEPSPGTPEWWFWRWSCVPGLSENPEEIHTGNSAYGALGLAYHLGFDEAMLVGVDGTDEPRVEGGRCKSLSHLPLLFGSAMEQISIVSCGKLQGVPHMSFNEWYRNEDRIGSTDGP